MKTMGRIAAVLVIAALFLCGSSVSVAGAEIGNSPVLRIEKSPVAADTAIEVKVTNVRERKGILNIYLFTKGDGFPTKSSEAFAVKRITLSTLASDSALGSLTVTFSGLAPGAYAVGVHHDKNGNGKVDSNFLGIPKEPVGCSNNVRPRFRAPHFDEARFSVVANETKVLSIEVK